MNPRRRTPGLGPRNAPCPVICIAGPTGSGKTPFAVKLAKMLGGEVINADSRQIYRDFPVISAQPSRRERDGVPHHLYGLLPLGEPFDANSWAELACARAREILARGAVPILAGGTGFYFRTLLEGIAAVPPVPAAISREMRSRLKLYGPNLLHEDLRRIDPACAAKIHKNDGQRITRALEVYAATGDTLSRWREFAAAPPLCEGPLLVLAARLSEIEAGLRTRIDAMLRSGAAEEAARALALQPDLSAPGWNGIGCRELAAWLQGETDLAQCLELWFKNTRAYAKRQITWFRGRQNAVFIGRDAVAEAAALAENFLEGCMKRI